MTDEPFMYGVVGNPTVYVAVTSTQKGLPRDWPGKIYDWWPVGSSDLERKGHTIEEWWEGPEETRNRVKKYLRDYLRKAKSSGLISEYRVGDKTFGIPYGPITIPLRRVLKR